MLSLYPRSWLPFVAPNLGETAKEPEAITITLPDGKTVDGQSWRTTPLEIAEGISKGLALSTVVSKVNDVQWDMGRPLEESCTLEFLKFDSEEGKYVSAGASGPAHPRLMARSTKRRGRGAWARFVQASAACANVAGTYANANGKLAVRPVAPPGFPPLVCPPSRLRPGTHVRRQALHRPSS